MFTTTRTARSRWFNHSSGPGEHWRFHHPLYELEWTDEAGAPILDPLGFGYVGYCSVGEGPTSRDLVAVSPGRVAKIPDTRGPHHALEVMPTARPGIYGLQLRYLAQGIEGATDRKSLFQRIARRVHTTYRVPRIRRQHVTRELASKLVPLV